MKKCNKYSPIESALEFSLKHCGSDYSLISYILELINNFISFTPKIQKQLLDHISLLIGRVSKDSFISILSIITNAIFNKSKEMNEDNVSVELKYMKIMQSLFINKLLVNEIEQYIYKILKENVLQNFTLPINPNDEINKQLIEVMEIYCELVIPKNEIFSEIKTKNEVEMIILFLISIGIGKKLLQIENIDDVIERISKLEYNHDNLRVIQQLCILLTKRVYSIYILYSICLSIQ